MRQFQSFSTVARETLSQGEPGTSPQKKQGESTTSSTNNIATINHPDAGYNETQAFIEVEIVNPRIHGPSNGEPGERFTDYEIIVHTNLPQFPKTVSKVRRRYSDFELFRRCLKKEVVLTDHRLDKVKIPHLPGKLLWSNKFDPEVIETRRQGLEQWTKFVASHPLLQVNSASLIRFLQRDTFSG